MFIQLKHMHILAIITLGVTAITYLTQGLPINMLVAILTILGMAYFVVIIAEFVRAILREELEKAKANESEEVKHSRELMDKFNNLPYVVKEGHALFKLSERFRIYLSREDYEAILNLERTFMKELNAYEHYVKIRREVSRDASNKFLKDLDRAVQSKLDKLIRETDKQLKQLL